MSIISAILAVLATAINFESFYLLGTVPTDYDAGERVPLLVKPLTTVSDRCFMSGNSIFRTRPPCPKYDYYERRFNFCQPHEILEPERDVLGSILLDDGPHNSPFELNMLRNETCVVLCKRTNTARALRFMATKIRENYKYNWVVGGLLVGFLSKIVGPFKCSSPEYTLES
jgi:transmembrane 9 superfamily protein 2/4